ncbi:zinc-binding alcohol dehydrogenase family protein [Paenibacillus sp. 3LSP]|uniref:zinc-binding alcohol dehydrogenase family protein n=1 Tax=Paenibacillus sp. 3LSP TaxID=2800795 RepID=UPI0028FD5DD8|nr:zinc-binding alcohol dehydrogenase family protein [Paenibacillus sp. 3LSP]MDU0331556.1 zinc-binding alcohol dehydrogenase family protein [Paenibacillus sp. 3LSP]
MANQTMKAVGFYNYLPIDHPESLLDLEIDRPVPTGRDLLVKVHAISVNPVDTKVRKPKSKVESSPRVIGWDVAGIVEEVGPDVTLFKPGDAVYYAGSITRPGGNSEFHLVDERIVGRKPASLDFAEAAALPLTAITAWEALYDRLGISKDANQNAGKTILIIGAAGGVGSIATQLAKHAGLTVIGTASRPESVKWVKELGADAVITHFEPFVPQLQAMGVQHVDYIFCLNTTEKHWKNMVDAIAPQGKICSIVETDEPVNISLLQQKSVTFVYELMFTRPMFQTEDMIEQHHLLNALADLIDQGVIRSTVAEKLSPINAANLRKAHALLESGRTIGKVVLEHFS